MASWPPLSQKINYPLASQSIVWYLLPRLLISILLIITAISTDTDTGIGPSLLEYHDGALQLCMTVGSYDVCERTSIKAFKRRAGLRIDKWFRLKCYLKQLYHEETKE